MSIFKIRNKKPNDMTPAAILRTTHEYIPQFYRESKHFQDSKEFLEQGAFGVALESLDKRRYLDTQTVYF